eukprot:TRINITY_DN18550_c1_g1_i1.p2 TRINITY_DN18550_c1_g1~~TRINITY_DN18550_c1_g1_i1.p2  ORF type:complete len:251 (-),score=76.16 TRINITY_DN18550_c1_g1_i1:838-1590(-)
MLGLMDAAMDVKAVRGPPARSPSGASPKPKREKTEAEEDNMAPEEFRAKVNNTLQLLCSLSMSHAHQLAVLRSCTLDNIIVPRDLPLINKVKETTKKFHDHAMALEKKQRSTLMSPHVLVWEQFMVFFSEKCKEHNLPEKETLIKAFQTEMEKMPREDKPKHVADVVRHCRIAKTHNKDYARIEVGLKMNPGYYTMTQTAPHTWEAMKYILVKHCKGDVKYGMQPKSDVLRRLEKTTKHILEANENRHDW